MFQQVPIRGLGQGVAMHAPQMGPSMAPAFIFAAGSNMPTADPNAPPGRSTRPEMVFQDAPVAPIEPVSTPAPAPVAPPPAPALLGAPFSSMIGPVVVLALVSGLVAWRM